MSETSESTLVLPVIIGTAGHVDHGKTSLVRQLTGFETDRLAEEQRRGVSIESRMAPFEMPGVGLVGLVDVPGHEDFIRNMVAGAASIDLLLLVVAADDAVMPQTIEHMRIAKLLGMSRVIAVITKIDLVDAELVSLVKDDIEEFLASSGYPQAPMFCVSNTTGDGVDFVREELKRQVANFSRPEDKRAFRMYLRNSFTIKGYGTVATGVPVSGTLQTGAEIEILPGQKKATVRAIQTYRRDSNSTEAHISSAINLRDLSTEELVQGTCLASPGIYSATKSAIVWLKNESDACIIKKRSTLRILVGTATRIARARLLDCNQLSPGESAFVEFRFSEALPLAAGDRYIARVLSPADTIGGGRVLTVAPAAVTKLSPQLTIKLKKAKEALSLGDLVATELFAGAELVVSKAKMHSLSQGAGGQEAIERLLASGVLVELPSGKAGVEQYLVAERLGEIASALARQLKRYHRANPYSWGMKPEHGGELLGIAPQAFSGLVNLLTKNSELLLRHGGLGLKSFTPQISAKEIKLREQMLAEIEKAGLASIAKGPLKDSLGMTQGELNLLVKLLVQEQLIAVAGNNLLPAAAIEMCRQVLSELSVEFGTIELKPFRERTGASRNIAVAILEQFDSEGVTKRQGEGRVLVSSSRKMAAKHEKNSSD